mmetsp:Transcript_34777/g.87458  ORF Transcript_34777/g.87458 Transcript_34777/m.87458 type:complete len:206 (-) Transcript_34777:1922-2539(-)
MYTTLPSWRILTFMCSHSTPRTHSAPVVPASSPARSFTSSTPVPSSWWSVQSRCLCAQLKILHRLLSSVKTFSPSSTSRAFERNRFAFIGLIDSQFFFFFFFFLPRTPTLQDGLLPVGSLRSGAATKSDGVSSVHSTGSPTCLLFQCVIIPPLSCHLGFFFCFITVHTHSQHSHEALLFVSLLYVQLDQSGLLSHSEPCDGSCKV